MDPYLLNQSLHKDFHYTLSLIFDFLKANYGKEEMDRIMKNGMVMIRLKRFYWVIT